MTTRTQFLDLPNELFPYIFQYLKSSKLVEVFSKIPCNRIQSLIQSHIYHLDISSESYEWVETYLADLFSRQIIYAIRLQDKHINYLSKYVFQTDIQSVHILNSDWSTDILKNGLDQLRQTIRQLTITFTYPHGKGDIANHLFRSDSRIECLNITGRFLYFDMTDIEICSKLTNLSIELEGMRRLFIILEHLPQLTDLKVKFRNEDRMVEPVISTNRLNSNSILNRVIFTGSTKYFEHLEIFFTYFGHSIEYLSIQLDLMYSISDWNVNYLRKCHVYHPSIYSFIQQQPTANHSASKHFRVRFGNNFILLFTVMIFKHMNIHYLHYLTNSIE